MIFRRRKLAQGVYAELVRSLFESWLPTVIMGCAFVGVSWLVNAQAGHPLLRLLAIIGGALSLLRVALLFFFRRKARGDAFDASKARDVELIYGSVYLSFAGILGSFGALGFQLATPQARMLLVTLLVGYCAGVATGAALRPWLSVTSMVVAVGPLVLVSAAAPLLIDRALAGLLVALLGGGINSVIIRQRSELSKIDMRRTLERLARRDPLTDLPNRLSLSDHYRAIAGLSSAPIAIHYIDLDRFKAVNDTYGHPTGDGLLQAVAARLGSLVRGQDLVVRLGGDEFIIYQSDVAQSEDAEALAWRIVHALNRPYQINGSEIRVGASVGCCMSTGSGHDLDHVIDLADEMLLSVKRQGGGAARLTSTLAQWRKLVLGMGVDEQLQSRSVH